MIKFNSIEESWFWACTKCSKEGHLYTIDRGSFSGKDRQQLEHLYFKVLPNGPLTTTFKGDYFTTDEQIVDYFLEYLFNDKLHGEESYTYGSRIVNHIPYLIKMLLHNPMTNQATIEVGMPSDIYLVDPPCLRSLSWKVVNGKLNLCSYWRSWDLFQGLPTNLGGLNLLNQYVSQEANIPEGSLICFSDGGHIYPHISKGYF